MSAFAPANGTMPVLQYVLPAQLSVDPDYQRSLDGHTSSVLIRRIARQWDWHLCQPLVVSRRGDGGLYVIDGQHRLAAAKERGDIAQLPCVIVEYDGTAGEAAAFVGLNSQRRALSPVDLFRAAVASGEDDAVAIADAIAAAGLILATHSNPNGWKPMMVFHIRGIQNCWRERGPTVTAEALCVLGEAFAGEVMQYAGFLFGGIAAVVHRGIGYDRARFVAILRQQSQVDWRQAALQRAANDRNESRAGAVRTVMMEAWRAADDAPKPAAAPEPVAPPSIGGLTPPVRSPKQWCKQCDAMVKPDKAAACASKFCSLRKAGGRG